MHSLVRRGFTLIELMIALVLLGIFGTSIYKIMVSHERIYRAQTQRIDLQENIRAAATLLPADFRLLDGDEGDILAMAADSIKIRAMRVFAIMCSPPVLGGALTGLTLTVRQAMTYGSRSFNAGTDSLFIYYEGDPASRSDDGWIPAHLTAAAAGNCPATDNPPSKPGTLLTADLSAAAFVAPKLNKVGMIPAGSPVWAYEIITYRLYQAPDGNWYVGLRNAAGIQPLIGPLIGNTGLTFSYYDSLGAVTAVPANVAAIEFAVRGRTVQPIRLPDGTQATQVDSVVMRVALRNNQRW